MISVRVTESDTALKFAALYVAEARGFFAEEGIRIKGYVDSGPGGSWLVDNLLAGKAEIAVGGIWLPLLYRQLGLGDLIPILALCHRHPGVILGRHNEVANFSWENLCGKRLLVPMAVTSQWMFLQGRLRALNVNVERIQIIRDLHIDTTSQLWRSGYGEYYLVEPLYADTFVREGYPIVTTMAEATGDVPWSVIYADGEWMRREPTVITAFKRAVATANRWIAETGEANVYEALSAKFPNYSAAQIMKVINRFIATGVWNNTVDIDQRAADEYQDIMIAYGLLTGRESITLADKA